MTRSMRRIQTSAKGQLIPKMALSHKSENSIKNFKSQMSPKFERFVASEASHNSKIFTRIRRQLSEL